MTGPQDTQPTIASGPGGSIYDLGYQGYHGSRVSRSFVVAVLLWQTLRACYGIGRGARAKIVPLTLAALALIPAVVAVGIALLIAQAGPAASRFESFSPIRYSTYANVIAVFVMLFCAAQAPELFGRDQRFGVLPLYFSRALARTDYAVARIGGLVAGLSIMVLTPQLVLFVGRLLMASDPVAGWGVESSSLLPVLLQSALTVGVMGGIAAVVASYTPRRAYATAGIIALLIIPPVIAELVAGIGSGGFARYVSLASPTDVLAQTNDVLFSALAGTSGGPGGPGGPARELPDAVYLATGCAWVVVTVGLTIRRYRRIAV
jgi:ABC-2 type transport system permease protein